MTPEVAYPGLSEFRRRFRSWLTQEGSSLLPYAGEGRDFAGRLLALRQLQLVLFNADWARYGWPVEYGGLGGDARHRAVLYDELALVGLGARSAFEHLEILAPALVTHGGPSLLAEMLPRLLSGRDLWCQGFSEPDAGSDLPALRTTARIDGEEFVINGRKVWTSWAPYAERCVVLARTGSPADRHRGLSVFFVDLDWPGIEVRGIRQANGVDELAEVTFDDVRVPRGRLIGPLGAGWPIALDILSCERSAFAWLRQARLYARADRLAMAAQPSDTRALGEVMLDLFALRVSSATAVEALAQGTFLGPAAAPAKVLMTDAEQHLYEAAAQILGPGLALGEPSIGGVEEWQEEYLFSKIVSVYGGTRQMQLTTVARFLLDLPSAPTR